MDIAVGNNRLHAMNAETLELGQTGQTEQGVREADGGDVWQCDVCGVVMLDLHCKLRCVNCGFMRDCSDP